jgi:thiol:disulfide interchange protein DsbA
MNNLFRSLALSLSLLAGGAHALAAEPVAGTNYEVLKNAQPTSAPPGKVEVIEFFWYHSPQCYKLEPAIEAFVKKEGDRIVFKRVAVAFKDEFLPHSVLYYSLVSLGLAEKLTPAVYNAIYQQHRDLVSRDDQVAFVATQGVDKIKFLIAHDSGNVMSQVLQANKLALYDYQIGYLPTLVVAGRYKIGPVKLFDPPSHSLGARHPPPTSLRRVDLGESPITHRSNLSPLQGDHLGRVVPVLERWAILSDDFMVKRARDLWAAHSSRFLMEERQASQDPILACPF